MLRVSCARRPRTAWASRSSTSSCLDWPAWGSSPRLSRWRARRGQGRGQGRGRACCSCPAGVRAWCVPVWGGGGREGGAEHLCMPRLQPPCPPAPSAAQLAPLLYRSFAVLPAFNGPELNRTAWSLAQFDVKPLDLNWVKVGWLRPPVAAPPPSLAGRAAHTRLDTGRGGGASRPFLGTTPHAQHHMPTTPPPGLRRPIASGRAPRCSTWSPATSPPSSTAWHTCRPPCRQRCARAAARGLPSRPCMAAAALHQADSWACPAPGTGRNPRHACCPAPLHPPCTNWIDPCPWWRLCWHRLQLVAAMLKRLQMRFDVATADDLASVSMAVAIVQFQPQ